LKLSNKMTESILNDPFIKNYILDSMDQDNTDCVRGAAEPVLKKNIFPKSEFKLLSDSLSGVEATRLDSNDVLIIKNWGCESYVLTFIFKTSHYNHDVHDTEFWYNTAFHFMNKIKQGIDSPVDIDKGITSLKEYIYETDSTKLEYDHELDFGINEVGRYVMVEPIRKIFDDYLVTVSYVIGPL
jgi:hypothetical protein